MKKFIFSMKSLLNLKKSLEKQHKAELAEVEQRLRRFRLELDTIDARYAGRRREFSELSGNGELRAADFLIYAKGFEALRDKQDMQKLKIQASELERERVQKKVVEVMRERKTLEKLEEKQHSQYLEECKREDELIIGEFVSYNVSKAGNGGEAVG